MQDAPAAGAVEPGIEGSPAPKMAQAAAAAAAEEEIEEGKIGGTTSTGRTAVLVGYGVKQTEAKRRPRKGAAAAPQAASRTVAARRPAGRPSPVRRPQPGPARTALPVAREGGARALAKPPVRKYAKDLGVDLAAVAGSGEGGIISRADVEAHAAGGRGTVPPAAPAPTAARGAGQRHTRHRSSPAAGSARRASRSRGSAR